MSDIQIKNNCVIFYGNPAGYLTEKSAVCDSILDEYYWLNKKDPNYSFCRATLNRGEDAHTNNKFGLSDKGCMEIMDLFMISMNFVLPIYQQ